MKLFTHTLIYTYPINSSTHIQLHLLLFLLFIFYTDTHTLHTDISHSQIPTISHIPNPPHPYIIYTLNILHSYYPIDPSTLILISTITLYHTISILSHLCSYHSLYLNLSTHLHNLSNILSYSQYILTLSLISLSYPISQSIHTSPIYPSSLYLYLSHSLIHSAITLIHSISSYKEDIVRSLRSDYCLSLK